MTTDLQKKLGEILKSPHQNSLGATVMTIPTLKLFEEITQAFVADGWVKEKRYCLVPPLGSDGEISLISQQDLDNARGEVVPVMTATERKGQRITK